MVRDKLPFNGVESKNHFGVTEKNAIYFDVLCQRNKVVLSDVNSLCRSFLDDFWKGFLCGMALMFFLYALWTLVLFFKRNFKHYGNS